MCKVVALWHGRAYRIDDCNFDFVLFDNVGNHLDGLGRSQHSYKGSESGSTRISRGKHIAEQPTSLDNIDTNITDTSINLLPHKCWGSIVNVNNALSVLGCQCRCGGHSVAPMGGNDFLVCLQATTYASASSCGIDYELSRSSRAV